MAAASSEIIEGVFRVVATTDVPARPSPNRRRAAVRIVCWNLAAVAAAVGLPILF